LIRAINQQEFATGGQPIKSIFGCCVLKWKSQGLKIVWAPFFVTPGAPSDISPHFGHSERSSSRGLLKFQSIFQPYEIS
jgi:hypothetical protein